MCDESEYLISTFQHENEIFKIFKKPLTYQQAEKSCGCLNAPFSTLAIVKTSTAFRRLKQALVKVSPDAQDWIIGLRRTDGKIEWADGEVLSTTPGPILPQTGDCYNVHISKSSAFLGMNQCDSINSVSGYVCSQPDKAPVPSGKKVQTMSPQTKLSVITDPTTTASDQTSGIPHVWIVVIIVLLTILILVLLALFFKKRQQKLHRSKNSILNRVTFGEINPQNDDGSVQYATIDELMELDENTAINTGQEGNDDICPVYESQPVVGDVYAVVNKRKSKDLDTTTTSQETKEDITYAVVNKNRSKTQK